MNMYGGGGVGYGGYEEGQVAAINTNMYGGGRVGYGNEEGQMAAMNTNMYGGRLGYGYEEGQMAAMNTYGYGGYGGGSVCVCVRGGDEKEFNASLSIFSLASYVASSLHFLGENTLLYWKILTYPYSSCNFCLLPLPLLLTFSLLLLLPQHT